jgi:glycosyltransferase involved in cell wall biosynthesis
VAAFRPDAVVGFGEFNLRLPLRLSRRFGVPLVVYMEYLRPLKVSVPVRGAGRLRKVAPALYGVLSRLFIRRLARRCAAIMFAYYGDRDRMEAVARHGTRVTYVPWCSDVGREAEAGDRNRAVGIYMGSLDPFKNAAELVKAIPIVLEGTETERFVVVGPGSYAEAVRDLARRFGDRVEYIPSLPRPDAIRRLWTAGYGYTPVTDCGLGFVGDCWGTGTPLVATHDLEGYLNPGVDALVARGCTELPAVIGSLLDSSRLYEACRREGRKRYEADLTAEAAAERYLEVLTAAGACRRPLS